MTEAFQLLQDMGEGMIWLALDGKRDIWTLITLRKPATCAVSGKEIVGKAYRPLTNGRNRMKRISTAVIDSGRASLSTKDTP